MLGSYEKRYKNVAANTFHDDTSTYNSLVLVVIDCFRVARVCLIGYRIVRGQNQELIKSPSETFVLILVVPSQ